MELATWNLQFARASNLNGFMVLNKAQFIQLTFCTVWHLRLLVVEIMVTKGRLEYNTIICTFIPGSSKKEAAWNSTSMVAFLS